MLINRFDEAIAQMTPQQINVLVGRLEQKMGLVRGLYRADQVIAHAKKYWDNPDDNEYQEDAIIGNKVRYTRNGKTYYRALPGKGKKDRPKGRRVKATYSHPEEERQAKALGKLALIGGGTLLAAAGGAAAAAYLYENRPWQGGQQGNNPSTNSDPNSDRPTPPPETPPPPPPSNSEPPAKPKPRKKPKPKVEEPPVEPPMEQVPEPPNPVQPIPIPIDIIDDEPDPIDLEPIPQPEPSPTLKGWQALGLNNQGAYSKTSPDGYAVYLLQNQDRTWLSSDTTGFESYAEHQTLGEAVEHGDRLLAKHQASMGLPEKQQENLSNPDKEKEVEAIAKQRQQEEAKEKAIAEQEILDVENPKITNSDGSYRIISGGSLIYPKETILNAEYKQLRNMVKAYKNESDYPFLSFGGVKKQDLIDFLLSVRKKHLEKYYANLNQDSSISLQKAIATLNKFY